MTNSKSNAKILIGKVVSNKMQKTIVVEVERLVKHPKYGKYVKLRDKFHAHDEEQVCQINNLVKIKESRPLSKTKTWVLVEVIS